MIGKILAIGLVTLGSAAGMTIVPPAVSRIGSAPNDAGTVAVADAAGTVESVIPSQMGASAVLRARTLMLTPPFLADGKIVPHAMDYTGFVGYAWNLPRDAEDDYVSWSQALRTEHAAEISAPVLEPGDVVATVRGDTFGQAVVFESWLDPKFWHNMVRASDEESVDDELDKGVLFRGLVMSGSKSSPTVVERVLTLRRVKGALIVCELEREAAGPYLALRNKNIGGFVRMWNDPVRLKNLQVGAMSYFEYTIVNDGGTPVQITGMRAVAYGPQADQQGLAGTQSGFPPEGNFTLMPGEMHTYKNQLKMDQPGRYFAVPTFVVNGITEVPVQGQWFDVVAAN